VLSFLVLLIYTHIISQRFYHVPYEYGRLAKMALIALAMFIIAGLINPGNIALSMIVKFLIAFSFPFVLYIFKFYRPEELAKLSQVRGQIYDLVKAKIGLGGA